MKLPSLLVLFGFGSSKVVTLNEGSIYFMLLVSTFQIDTMVVSHLLYLKFDAIG